MKDSPSKDETKKFFYSYWTKFVKKKVQMHLYQLETQGLYYSIHIYIRRIKSSRPHLQLQYLRKKAISTIDIGSNVDCKPSHLLQFALMEIAFQKHIHTT